MRDWGIANYEGDAKKVVADYRARVKKILAIHDKNKLVTPEYASRWAASSPDTYLDLVTSYLSRVRQIKSLLREARLQPDTVTLGRLAFDPDRQTEVTVATYIEKRKLLAELYKNHPKIEAWMIDQVASLDVEVNHMRRGINTLLRIKQETGTARLKELAPFMHLLTPLDQRAIVAVLGLADSANKTALQEELGVEDLDTYVMDEVVPHLIRTIRLRNT